MFRLKHVHLSYIDWQPVYIDKLVHNNKNASIVNNSSRSFIYRWDPRRMSGFNVMTIDHYHLQTTFTSEQTKVSKIITSIMILQMPNEVRPTS